MSRYKGGPSTVVPVRLKDEELAKLDKLCKKNGVKNRSDMVRLLVSRSRAS